MPVEQDIRDFVRREIDGEIDAVIGAVAMSLRTMIATLPPQAKIPLRAGLHSVLEQQADRDQDRVGQQGLRLIEAILRAPDTQ